MIRRRIFTVVSAASLLLCVTAAVIWVRSYFYEEGIVTPLAHEWGGGIVASRGSLFTFAFQFQGFNRVEQFRVVNDSIPPDLTQEIGDLHSFAGFAYRWDRGFVYAAAVPLWLVLILVLAVFVFLIRRLRVGPSDNACVRCGYNVTGNTSGTCPECGTAVPRKSEATA